MMQFVFFGAGKFARAVLKGLQNFDDVQITLFEQNEQLLNQLRGVVTQPVIVDLKLKLQYIRHLPEEIDGVIIDLGKDTETTLQVILDVNTIYQNPRIIVATDNPDLRQIYDKVGVTDVIVPNEEAANHLLPFLISRLLYSYIPIGKNFVMAEIGIPAEFHHKTFRSLNLRQRYGLNVVAIRHDKGDYELFELDYMLNPNDNLLVVGTTENVHEFLNAKREVKRPTLKKLVEWFQNTTIWRKPGEKK